MERKPSLRELFLSAIPEPESRRRTADHLDQGSRTVQVQPRARRPDLDVEGQHPGRLQGRGGELTGFTPEQQLLWNRYAEAREECGSVGEIVLGFSWICQLEGVEPPSEAAIRAAIAAA